MIDYEPGTARRLSDLDGEETISVLLEHIANDTEVPELMLLARLNEIGYRARRG